MNIEKFKKWLNERPVVAMSGLLIVLIVSGIYAFVRSQGAGPPIPEFSEKAFFTVDDGATYFPDDGGKQAPFEHKGQTAVRARVFTADGGQTKWVGYLEKFVELPRGAEYYVKPAQRGKWVPRASPAGHAVINYQPAPLKGPIAEVLP